MTVRGGRVWISWGDVCNEPYPPRMHALIEIIPHFPEDIGELTDIVHKRLIEAQAKINLEICGIMEADE